MSEQLRDGSAGTADGADAAFAAMEALADAKRAVAEHKRLVVEAWHATNITVAEAQDIYWTHEHVTTNLLAAACGLTHGRFLLDGLPPQPLPYLCDGCLNPKFATNRTDYLRENKAGGLCHDCYAAKRRAGQLAYRQQEEVRKTRLDALRAMPYRDYLLSPEWNATRVATLRRCKGACMVCNAHVRLDVHHRTYERLGQERAADLIALCRTCHGLFHANGKLAR